MGALGIALVIAVWRFLLPVLFPSGMGGWAVLVVPTLLAGALYLMLLLGIATGKVESLLRGRRACPACGERRWLRVVVRR